MRKPVIIAMISIMCACKHQVSLQQAQDKELTVQVIPVVAVAGETGTLNYQARIIPGKAVLAKQTYQQKTAMLYQMDSCFYLQKNGKKTYPVLVQAVANGVAGTFEYMVEFELPGRRDMHMVYDDRYLTGKKYELAENN